MAVRGRKPKPYLVKQAEGNRGHRKLKPGVEPAPGAFDPPLPLAGIALTEWNRLMAECYWLKATEAFAIADRCLCVARMYEAEQDIAERGNIIRTRNGKVKNPSIQIARSYRLAVQKYDVELGLTTTSRQRLHDDAAGGGPAAKGPSDPIEDALCG